MQIRKGPGIWLDEKETDWIQESCNFDLIWQLALLSLSLVVKGLSEHIAVSLEFLHIQATTMEPKEWPTK